MFAKYPYSQNSVNKPESVGDLLQSYEHLLQNHIEDDPLKAKIIKTPVGPMIAVANEHSLLFLTFIDGQHFDEDLKHLLKSESKTMVADDKATQLKSIENELHDYFNGKLSEFKTPVAINDNETDFQRSVWQAIQKIGYGETCSYSELANAIQKPKSYRAVANACGRNPIAILIPCHRVLKTDNGMGGYRSGVERKVWLLDHEKKQMKY